MTSAEHAPDIQLAKLIDKMPEPDEPLVKKALSNLGEYLLEDHLFKEFEGLPQLGPYLLDTGSIYQGQW